MLLLHGSGDDDTSPLMSRRAWMSVAWIALIAAAAAALAGTGRFMFPNVINEPDGLLNEQQPLDASGLKFHPTANGWYTVAAVAPHSPGADAGVQQGDVLLQIDGKDASQLTLGDINALLSRPAATYILRIDRLGWTRTATLQLKNTI